MQSSTTWLASKQHKLAPRLQSNTKLDELRKFIATALEQGLIEPSQAESWSQILLTPKPNGKWRFCVDYRYLNQLTKSMGWPLPNIKQMLERIGSRRAKYFAVLDLTQGYFQAAISKKSRELTAFRTAEGLYQWTRLPMGLKGAPAYFQHAMQNTVLGDILYKICEVYLDDIIVFANTEEELLQNLEEVFSRLERFNITLNPSKVRIGMSSVEYVGHTIDEEGLSFSKDKIKDVLVTPKPETQKQLKSFLGLCVQFKDHIRQYSDIVKPMHNMLAKYTPSKRLRWTTETEECFNKLLQSVNDCPKLFFLDLNAEVFLHTDASQYGIGGYLYQLVDGKHQPIAFISKTLNSTELKWSTPEKEAYAIFYSLNKLDYLLRDIKFTLRTDHKNLTFINTDFREKVKRWKLAIQHFDFDIEHIKGVDNIEADGFSRLCQLPTVEEIPTEMLLANTEIDPRLSMDTYQKIASVHNSDIGHFGVDKTIAKLQSVGTTWSTMRHDVNTFIKRCPCCQKMSVLKIPIQTQPFTLASYSPMDRICVDTIGPLPVEKETDAKYILVIIDAFSRFVKLHAIKDTSALAALPGLMDWVGLFGIPSEVVTDNGTQFANQLVDEFLELLETKNAKIQAYSKEENGIVERANREVNRHLRTIVYNRKVKPKWATYLPLVQRIMNASIHSTIGVSPAQIVFGNSVRLDRQLLPLKIKSSTTYLEHLEDLLETQAEIIRTAERNQLDNDQFHISKRGGQAITEFPINSYVTVNYEADHHRPPSKLHTFLRGRLRVVSYRGPIYTLQNLVTNKLEDFHVKLLHPFNYDAATVDPAEVAQHDGDYFEIKEVMSHRFKDRKNKNCSNLEFQILWIGDKEPVWQPWSSDLGANELVHKYLNDNSLRRCIPSKYTYPKDHPQYEPPVPRRATLPSNDTHPLAKRKKRRKI